MKTKTLTINLHQNAHFWARRKVMACEMPLTVKQSIYPNGRTHSKVFNASGTLIAKRG